MVGCLQLRLCTLPSRASPFRPAIAKSCRSVRRLSRATWRTVGSLVMSYWATATASNASRRTSSIKMRASNTGAHQPRTPPGSQPGGFPLGDSLAWATGGAGGGATPEARTSGAPGALGHARANPQAARRITDRVIPGFPLRTNSPDSGNHSELSRIAALTWELTMEKTVSRRPTP